MPAGAASAHVDDEVPAGRETPPAVEEPASPSLSPQFPPFDAAADAELGAQLAHAAEAMAGQEVEQETAPSEPEAGLGSVEGDEVAAAAEEASEVHEAAVEGEAEAGELADEVAAESDDEGATESDSESATESESAPGRLADRSGSPSEGSSVAGPPQAGGRVLQWLRRRRNR